MKNTENGALIAAAVASLIGAIAPDAWAGKSAKHRENAGVVVQCGGINSCKGQGACAGNGNACKAMNECKGKGFVEVDSAKACSIKGGRVMEQKKM